MKVRNRKAEAMPSSITPHQFGRAMAQLDLSTVSPEKRVDALMDHLGAIMAQTVTDPSDSADLHTARLLRLQRQRG